MILNWALTYVLLCNSPTDQAVTYSIQDVPCLSPTERFISGMPHQPCNPEQKGKLLFIYLLLVVAQILMFSINPALIVLFLHIILSFLDRKVLCSVLPSCHFWCLYQFSFCFWKCWAKSLNHTVNTFTYISFNPNSKATPQPHNPWVFCPVSQFKCKSISWKKKKEQRDKWLLCGPTFSLCHLVW